MRSSLSYVVSNKLYTIEKNNGLQSEIIAKIGKEAYDYLINYINIEDTKTFYLPSELSCSFGQLLKRPYLSIVSIEKINNFKGIDKCIGSINEKLVDGGVFFGCCETGNLKKKQIFSNYLYPLNHFLFFMYFFSRRIFPRLPVGRRIYRFLTKEKYTAMSKIELFGRLYFGGFEIVSEKEIGYLHYFVVKKTKKPCRENSPDYFPVIKLRRIGKNGKLILVYKLRTMHPYSEYLQEYIYQKNQLASSGKFNNDIRISPLGVFMRKIWIDELPMIVNLIKGDIKLFGVRPLSDHYYNLYDEELKQMRIKYKPGLIPPYYVHLPKSFEGIMESEKKYLLEYEKTPFLTDLKYLVTALFNILIKGNISK